MRQVHSFRVEADHPALEGHFPGRPIVPGVVLLDEPRDGRVSFACASGERRVLSGIVQA